MVLHLDICALYADCAQSGRDGVDGSHVRRSGEYLLFRRWPYVTQADGDQYHWVSEFAPERYQKFLSYFAGWQSTLAWQAGNASGPFVTGALMQALIYVRNPSYEGTDWQESLLVIANVLLLLVVNVWGARFLPSLQNAFALLHVVFFAAIIISLWAKAPHASATQVFAVFENSSGFSNLGLSLCIGQISAIWGLIGSDAPAHMAEVTS
jgi:amino acid transporter